MDDCVFEFLTDAENRMAILDVDLLTVEIRPRQAPTLRQYSITPALLPLHGLDDWSVDELAPVTPAPANDQ